MKISRLSLNGILTIILCFLALIIALTTLAVPGIKKRRSTNLVRQAQSMARGTEPSAAYRGIGRLRAVTAAAKQEQSGTTLIISPYFSYTAGDTEFFEELSRKNTAIKGVIMQYVALRTKAELTARGENGIKEDLRGLINDMLVLNKIQDVYFEEFNYLE